VWIAVVFLCQLNSAVGGVGAFADADGEIGFDSVLSGAREDGVAIGVVAFAFEMSVRVDEHGRWSFAPSLAQWTGETPVTDAI